MNPKLYFRISAVLLLLFAAGHTFGFLSFTPSTAEGRAVRASMDSVRFADAYASYSYGDFYRGFGLSITTTQIFSAWLAWFLAGLAGRSPRDASSIGWALSATQVVGIVLSLRYFSVAPAVFSFVAFLLLAAGAYTARRVSALRP